jgi:uncharacterized small protein (DUF1192 family)
MSEDEEKPKSPRNMYRSTSHLSEEIKALKAEIALLTAELKKVKEDKAK